MSEQSFQTARPGHLSLAKVQNCHLHLIWYVSKTSTTWRKVLRWALFLLSAKWILGENQEATTSMQLSIELKRWSPQQAALNWVAKYDAHKPFYGFAHNGFGYVIGMPNDQLASSAERKRELIMTSFRMSAGHSFFFFKKLNSFWPLCIHFRQLLQTVEAS